MSSPLRLDVLVVPYKPIAGLVPPTSKGEATWPVRWRRFRRAPTSPAASANASAGWPACRAGRPPWPRRASPRPPR
jgi:hypothetical protein